ncbi:hypothetical protein GQR58_023037 [Nymphon striatum]|nr:hypothetical protein GQR58_023037 [Nymphon striatum]
MINNSILAKSNKLKIFNDPIYGFIRIPNSLIFDLIAHPYFQRLRRISQMGLSYLVYPGAHHTRFHHALGSMHLMQKAVQVLRFKEVEITTDEEQGLLCAILLHDIGHGPFSHAMENSIVEGVHHEHISLLFMEDLNTMFNGSLTTAIEIFKGDHPKKFLNQLVSSQLDMDRMDYLKRDSFYTGVSGRKRKFRKVTHHAYCCRMETSQIAEILKGKVEGNSEIAVHKLAKIEEGEKGSLTFLANPKYTPHIYTTKASVTIVNKDFTPEKQIATTLIKVDDAYESFSKLLEYYDQVRSA